MDKREAETLYSKLGVHPSASAEEIHRAYSKLSEKFLANAGDNSGQTTEVSEDDALFRELTSAYRTLVDAESRRAYDRQVSPEPEATLVIHDLQDAQHEMARYQEVVLPQHEPTEQWRKEREYFEEHFEEILKPAPKVDLIDSASSPVTGESTTASDSPAQSHHTKEPGDDDVVDTDVTVKFGTFPTDRELSSFPPPKCPRRPIDLRKPLEPMEIFMYVGLPLFGVIILLEVYFFVM
jgi:DnaJ-class molecular chaperone